MEVFEDRTEWAGAFRAGWLAHLEATGETDFKTRYAYVKNATAPSGPALDLSKARLLLVTSSGAVLKGEQTPFDAPNLLGDYSTRTFDRRRDLADFDFVHEHYDHAFVERDPGVALPLRCLEDLEHEGRIGALAETVVSFSGYMPDATRVVDELIPAVLDVARAERVEGALLVPV